MAKVGGVSSRASRSSSSRAVKSGRRNSTGTRRMGSAARASRSRGSSTNQSSQPRYVVCVDTGGNHDLQIRRIYEVLADPSAARSNFIRVIDDSGEDYLYQADLFLPFQPTSSLRSALRRGSRPGV